MKQVLPDGIKPSPTPFAGAGDGFLMKDATFEIRSSDGS
jgi:hypothetical protein